MCQLPEGNQQKWGGKTLVNMVNQQTHDRMGIYDNGEIIVENLKYPLP